MPSLGLGQTRQIGVSIPSYSGKSISNRSTRSRPICIPSVHPTAAILQLEARSISRSNRYLQPTVGSIKGICKSSMMLSRQSSDTSEEPTGSNNSCGSGVEGTIVVSSPAGNVVQLPKVTSTRLIDTSGQVIPQSSDRVPTTTGSVAYLRQIFGSANPSNEAKMLLLASWRSKTLQSHDSHFSKCLQVSNIQCSQ